MNPLDDIPLILVIVLAVLTLITDLDRPNMTLFKMNQSLMSELEHRMEGATPWESVEGQDQ
ncbi:hypothetical protein ACFL07_01980 [Pseudomonadota bacterium]